MIFETWLSIIACLAVLALTMLLVKRSPATLALPLSYMINLLLIHVPGAYAFAFSDTQYDGLSMDMEATPTGILLTTVAAICFLIGCSLSIANNRNIGLANRWIDSRLDPNFIIFCLITGWILAFTGGLFRGVASLNAVMYFGGAVWMLATMTSLAAAVRYRNPHSLMIWFAILMVFPLAILLLGGFMSYGTVAVIIVGSLAITQMRGTIRPMLLIIVVGYLGISIFVNYFDSRAELRSTLWSGAGMEERVGAVTRVFSNADLFSPTNPRHLRALSMRLNQNEFVGVAADRLSTGQVEYLHGKSFYEAMISPIPRVLWPDKPVEGGSGRLVADMTGIKLSTNASWGVGNVMEFYINFGLWSLIPGFLLLGWLIGWLDRRAAVAFGSSDPSRSLVYFLPGIALIQPNGSLVEVVGGASAALIAALIMRSLWLVFRPGLALAHNQMPQQGRFARR